MKIGRLFVAMCLLPLGLLSACKKDSKDDQSETIAPPTIPVVTTENPGFGLKDELSIVDDFKACDPDLKTSVSLAAADTKNWFPFDDNNSKGDSVSILALKKPESGAGYCYISWTGTVSKALDWGFSGLGVNLQDGLLENHSKILLLTRGDGKSYRLAAAMKELAGEGNFHGTAVKCGDGSANWVPLLVEYSSLLQPTTWGNLKLTFAAASVDKIQFQIDAQGAFNCDIGGLAVLN